MVILPHLDILDICFDSKTFLENRTVFNIIYNSKSKICFSKNYIELLEKSVKNKDAFFALISELSDTGRIKIEDSAGNINFNEEFVEIAKKAKIPLLIPLSINDLNNNIKSIPFLTVINGAKPLNKHWVIIELLSKDICNVCYQDFNSDLEINEFVKSILLIPKFIRNVVVFDREQNSEILSSIKGYNISYYTMLKSGYQNLHLRKEIKKDLQMKLGGKLKLFYTSNNRKIHERKIILEDILITFDNSRFNLNTTEPTWEILISFNSERASKWKQKCNDFIEVFN